MSTTCGWWRESDGPRPVGSRSWNRFNPGLYRDGKLFNVEMGAIFEFAVTDDRAGAVTLRTIEGTALGEGKRGGKQ